MGHNSSLPRVDAFSPEEVQRLEKRFHKLDLDRSGTISIGEFVSVPELKENPLVKRVVDIFDSDLNGEVDFKGKSIERASILFFHVPYIITYLLISNLLILVSQSLKENEKLLKFAVPRHDPFAIRSYFHYRICLGFGSVQQKWERWSTPSVHLPHLWHGSWWIHFQWRTVPGTVIHFIHIMRAYTVR